MGSWGTGAFENDAAADFVAGLIDHVHRVTSKEPVRPRWRSADTYEEARAAGKFILLAHGQDVLGGPSLLDVLRALAHIRGDADWLSNWNAPRSIAAAIDIDIDEVLATMRACKGCKGREPEGSREDRGSREGAARTGTGAPARAEAADDEGEGREDRSEEATAEPEEVNVPGAVDPHTCSHEALELGFEYLGGEPRQCSGCGVWFIEEYEESFDGEEESCWFWLAEVPAPQTET